jgi:hypothetical protein
LLSEYFIFPNTALSGFSKGLLIIIIIVITMFSPLHLTSIIQSPNGNWFFFGDGGGKNNKTCVSFANSIKDDGLIIEYIIANVI